MTTHLAHVYDDLRLHQLALRKTSKWTRFGADVIPAWIAEMDYPIAPIIRDALVAAIERGETGYPPGGESDDQKIVAEGHDQKRGIEDTQQEQSESAEIKEEGEQMADKGFQMRSSPVILE